MSSHKGFGVLPALVESTITDRTRISGAGRSRRGREDRHAARVAKQVPDIRGRLGLALVEAGLRLMARSKAGPLPFGSR